MTPLTTENPPIGECPTFRVSRNRAAPSHVAAVPSSKKTETRPRIGLFGIGLDTYWPQFPGLFERLRGYQAAIADKLRGLGGDVVDGGIVDNPLKSREAAERFRREGVDLVLLNISTYALSSTVLPLAQTVAAPIVVLNLQPVPKLDYAAFNALGDRRAMTGAWLEHCQACSAPEIACVFRRAGIDYRLVTGYLDDKIAWKQIAEWVEAVKVRRVMRENRVGILGHYYCGMLDVYSDLTQQSAVFGNHFELLEMCELRQLREQVTPEQIQSEAAAILRRVRRRSAMRGLRIGASRADLLRSGCLGRETSTRFDGLLL